MPDSKPNPRKVELLKEWLEDLLKPGYVNQRIESLKKAIYKNKASEVRVLIKPTKQSFNPSFGAGEVSLPLPRRHEHHGFGGTGGNPIKFILRERVLVNLEQVCSDFNFKVVVTYCSSFAEELPTKKEVEAVPFSIP